jgi:hypothetical protein
MHLFGTASLAVASLVPTPIGVGPAYHPPAGAHAAAGLRCSARPVARVGVHLEVFANRRVVLVPPGVGIAGPLVRSHSRVVAGACSFPLRTTEPTGTVEVERGARLALGQFFAVWGQPLARGRLASFRGRVHAYVNGRPRGGAPRRIRLVSHANVVLEVGGYIPPHPRYLFPPGL